MTKSKLFSIVPALTASWLLAGCPDDGTEPTSDSQADSTTEDPSDSDPDSTASVTITSADTTDSTTMTTTMSTTMTTDDPTTTTDDPTTTTDDPTTTTDDPTTTTEDPTTTTEDPTSESGTETGSSTDPSATGTEDTGTLECVDQDLADDLPVSEMGTNMGFGDDFIPSCADGNDEDFVFEWTAPADGTYVFDTIGSDYDTILTILVDCGGEELACSDDIDTDGGNFNSLISGDIMAGTTLLIVVDGWDETGNFVLNITQEEPNMGVPYGNCFADDISVACSETEEFCLVDNQMAPTAGACTQFPCEADADCPEAPMTGDAPAICQDLGGGNFACLLDCSGGETCPDGMECIGDFFCGWTS